MHPVHAARGKRKISCVEPRWHLRSERMRWKCPGVKVVPRISVQCPPPAMPEPHVQPVAGDLLETLPLSRSLFPERTRRTPAKRDASQPVLKSVGIPANLFCGARKHGG